MRREKESNEVKQGNNLLPLNLIVFQKHRQATRKEVSFKCAFSGFQFINRALSAKQGIVHC